MLVIEAVREQSIGNAGDGQVQTVRSCVQCVHRDGGVLACAGRRSMNHCHRKLAGNCAGDTVLQFVGFVHHHHVVLRQHGKALERANGEHRMVGDHNVRFGRPGPRLLTEAFLGQGALLCAQAFHGGYRHLPPRTVRHPGHEFVAVSGNRAFRPLPQAENFLAQLR